MRSYFYTHNTQITCFLTEKSDTIIIAWSDRLEAVISHTDRRHREKKGAHQEKQQAGPDGSSVVGKGELAVFVGLQTSCIGQYVGNIALLLDSVEEV